MKQDENMHRGAIGMAFSTSTLVTLLLKFGGFSGQRLLLVGPPSTGTQRKRGAKKKL